MPEPHVEMERVVESGRVMLRVRQIPLLTSYTGASGFVPWVAETRDALERLQRRGA
jgi:hypothetical protein